MYKKRHNKLDIEMEWNWNWNGLQTTIHRAETAAELNENNHQVENQSEKYAKMREENNKKKQQILKTLFMMWFNFVFLFESYFLFFSYRVF